VNSITAVLFDLDGTLVDTAPDMASALNALLKQEQRQTLPFERIRPVVSKGSLALVQLGFGSELTEARLRALQQAFLEKYSQAICVQSRLFQELDSLLDELDDHEIPWGVVTNKPAWLTEPLLRQLNLYERCACIVSGDTLPRRKPYPDPLLHACQLMQKPPEECVYVGDDERDVVAGKAAGMRTLIAGYGYLGADETPKNWGADGMIDGAEHLRQWLRNNITPLDP
jgi:phosphoglycolate phosphatase